MKRVRESTNPEGNRAARGSAMAGEGASLPKKRFFRQRAHVNPLGGAQLYEYPIAPERMNWGQHFPAYASPADASLLAP